jgi:hypothetical protein
MSSLTILVLFVFKPLDKNEKEIEKSEKVVEEDK